LDILLDGGTQAGKTTLDDPLGGDANTATGRAVVEADRYVDG